MKINVLHCPKSGTFGYISRTIPECQIRKFTLISPLTFNCDNLTSCLQASVFSPEKWGKWITVLDSCLMEQWWGLSKITVIKYALCSIEPYTNVCYYYYYYCYYDYYYTMFFRQDIYVKLTQHIIGVLKLNKWSQLSDSFKINDVITT